MFQRLRNCLFLLRRALGLLDVFRLCLVVILTLDDAVLLLHLCDIQTADLQAAMLKNVILDLSIGCRSSFILHQFLNVHINVDMYCRFSQN